MPTPTENEEEFTTGAEYDMEGELIHVGHYTMFGTYYCDTCESPYCDLA